GLAQAWLVSQYCIPPTTTSTFVIVVCAAPSDGAASSTRAKRLPINLGKNACLAFMCSPLCGAFAPTASWLDPILSRAMLIDKRQSDNARTGPKCDFHKINELATLRPAWCKVCRHQ